MLVQCMNLKKIGKVFTSKFVGTGPSSYKKKNLLGHGLTKVEKHWFNVFIIFVKCINDQHTNFNFMIYFYHHKLKVHLLVVCIFYKYN
jgi:hypothetical protein